MRKKCVCIKNYNIFEDFSMDFRVGEIYEYEIKLKSDFHPFEMDERTYIVYDSKTNVSFNHYFHVYFVDLRKAKVKKLWRKKD